MPEVYPRVYGETLDSSGDCHLSPRVRGNPALQRASYNRDGSIPACTGKPLVPACPAQQQPVYPRVYGETHMGYKSVPAAIGLSPRVRGNLQDEDARSIWIRSIPACTGKPLYGAGLTASRRVYPRVYGETAPRPVNTRPNEGLSPRVRGNHSFAMSARSQSGSIPACTGKPAPDPA